MLLSIEQLKGRPIVAADGHVVGELVSMLVDTRTMAIATVRLRLRKEIADRVGVHRSVLHAPSLDIPARAVQSVGDAVVLGIPLSELRALHDAERGRRPEPRPDERPEEREEELPPEPPRHPPVH